MDRGVHVQRSMSSHLIIVGCKLAKDPAQMSLKIVLVIRERPHHSTQNEILFSITQLRKFKTWGSHRRPDILMLSPEELVSQLLQTPDETDRI
jgi:hypothetical protein